MVYLPQVIYQGKRPLVCLEILSRLIKVSPFCFLCTKLSSRALFKWNVGTL